MNNNFRDFGEPHFKFKVLHHDVVALRGEDGRKAFFNTKGLDFLEGYRILMGATPSLKEISIEEKNFGDIPWLNKYIATLMNKKRLSYVLPSMLEDVDRRLLTWGKTGRIDPFKTIYDFVFQITIRMATCKELAIDLKSVGEIQSLYWTLEKSATPTALLLPWLPGSAKKRKEVATKELFTKLSTVVEMRRHADVPSSDAIDVLLGHGLDTVDIVQFILSVIFAGVINTGMISSWTIVFLASHPEWKDKVSAEINDIIKRYTDTLSNYTLHKQLAAIPFDIWEDEMPVLELVIRETIRLVSTGTVLRRSLLEDLSVSEGHISKGDFLAYSLGDVHLNSGIYLQPYKFDPSRYELGREEDKKGTFSYLGWGAGRPCAGMKIAKLEIKIIVALLVGGYNFDMVDGTGKHLDEPPQPDRNVIHQARPLGEPCYLKIERVVE